MSSKSRRHKSRHLKTIALLVFILIVIMISALILGPNHELLLKPQILLTNSTERYIVTELRLPRVMIAFLIGASLSIAGVGAQGFFRNPLADPYFLGLSGGSSVGAAIALMISTEFVIGWTVFGGVLGAVAVGIFLIALSAKSQKNSETILLIGISLSLLCAALLSLILYFSGEQASTIVYWLMGSLSGLGWVEVVIVAAVLVIGWVLLFTQSRNLDLNLLGQTSAFSLGVDLKRFQVLMIISISILVTVSVCFSGAIGFVGLIIPHFTRQLIASDHRSLLLTAPLMGGMFLVFCDTVARLAVLPGELPIGVVTGIIGAPLFIYILLTKQSHDRT